MRSSKGASIGTWAVGAMAALLLVPFLAAQQIQYADLVLRGGKVITVDAQDHIWEAVAVTGNRISAVGTNQEISAWLAHKPKSWSSTAEHSCLDLSTRILMWKGWRRVSMRWFPFRLLR
jgi:hypothetical protein